LLLAFFGKVRLEVFPAVIAGGVTEPATFILAGFSLLLAGSLKWGVATTVLGALACRLAWQRRSANDSARL